VIARFLINEMRIDAAAAKAFLVSQLEMKKV
jgi:hypothetical protein